MHLKKKSEATSEGEVLSHGSWVSCLHLLFIHLQTALVLQTTKPPDGTGAGTGAGAGVGGAGLGGKPHLDGAQSTRTIGTRDSSGLVYINI